MKDDQAFKEEAALRREVGGRLRATADELGYRSAQALADYLGATRPQVAAWFEARAMPPVKYMKKLAVNRGITMDWIYRGDGSGLSNAMYIRLIAAMEGQPPPDVLPEPEPEPGPEPESGSPVHPLRKARGHEPQPARTKRASAT